MKIIVENHTKHLVPIREAALLVSYSRDYITRLAREGKISARWIGRQWFVDTDSLQNYVDSVQAEQQIRNQLLSEERKQEHELRQQVNDRDGVQTSRRNVAPAFAVAATALVFVSGGVLASFLYTISTSGVPTSQTNLAAQLPAGVADHEVATMQVAAMDTMIVPHFTTIDPVTQATTTGVVLVTSGSADGVAFEALFSDDVRLTTVGTTTVVTSSNGQRTAQLEVVSVPAGVAITSRTP